MRSRHAHSPPGGFRGVHRDRARRVRRRVPGPPTGAQSLRRDQVPGGDAQLVRPGTAVAGSARDGCALRTPEHRRGRRCGHPRRGRAVPGHALSGARLARRCDGDEGLVAMDRSSPDRHQDRGRARIRTSTRDPPPRRQAGKHPAVGLRRTTTGRFRAGARVGRVRDHEPAHHGIGVPRRAGDPRRQGTERCRRCLFAGIDAVRTRRRRPGLHRRRRGVVGRALRADRLVTRSRTERVGGAAIVLRGAGLGDVEAAPGTADDGGGVRPHAAGRRAGRGRSRHGASDQRAVSFGGTVRRVVAISGQRSDAHHETDARASPCVDQVRRGGRRRVGHRRGSRRAPDTGRLARRRRERRDDTTRRGGVSRSSPM